MPLKLVNWNVKWATRRAPRRHEIRRRIEENAPEVICLTETDTELWTQEGFAIHCKPDYGYQVKEGRRKVILWSKEPWEQVDDLGIDSLPPGRFVSGITQTSEGDVTVIGVCIPWKDSRTEARRGPERKERWEDHKQYLAGLTHVLKRAPTNRLIVVGDFNQRIGQSRYAPPRDVRDALQRAVPSSMSIATSELQFEGRKSIDHIALSDDLVADSLDVISNLDGKTELSDHFGVVAEVSVNNPAP